jgi:HD-GYP domain-containing protein (c-di-GMP phosphodiesterase class II)
MRTDRVYRKALSYEVARAELVGGAGSQFDPRVVEVFLSVLEQHEPEATARRAAHDQVELAAVPQLL